MNAYCTLLASAMWSPHGVAGDLRFATNAKLCRDICTTTDMSSFCGSIIK